MCLSPVGSTAQELACVRRCVDLSPLTATAQPHLQLLILPLYKEAREPRAMDCPIEPDQTAIEESRGGGMAAQGQQATASSSSQAAATQLGDLPEACLAQAIALTSPRDACRCAAVSPAFRAAADSDHVWRAFLPAPPPAVVLQQAPAPARSSKEAYLGLCDAANALDAAAGRRVWLERATGARCYALPARSLSLPWDDGEFSWKFAPHPRSRFAEVAELVDCTCLDIYGALPASALTPATPYAAYLVYATAEAGHRGLSYPDQETAVAVGGRVAARHAVCLRPDDDDARKFRGAGGGAGGEEEPRRPRLREDGWWEMEMGRVDGAQVASAAAAAGAGEEEVVEVVASFEVLGWYPKKGLVIEAIEFRPVAAVHGSTT